jgi:hypothetical protein
MLSTSGGEAIGHETNSTYVNTEAQGKAPAASTMQRKEKA